MMAASAAVFGFGAVASAQTYTTSLTVGAPGAGAPYSSTYLNCVPGETITFVQPNSTPTSTTGLCTATTALTSGSVIGLLLPQQAANGTAVGNFAGAPLVPGTYTVTGTGTTSPARTAQFNIPGQATTTTLVPATTLPNTGAGAATTVPAVTTPATVPGSGLPATGSDGIGVTTMIAIGLLVVGLGLFAVAQERRRHPSLA